MFCIFRSYSTDSGEQKGYGSLGHRKVGLIIQNTAVSVVLGLAYLYSDPSALKAIGCFPGKFLSSKNGSSAWEILVIAVISELKIPSKLKIFKKMTPYHACCKVRLI